MIVLGRIDVNKKPFRLIQIPDFLKRDPASVDCFEQIEWPPLARLDQLCRTLAAGVDPVKRGKRLRPSVLPEPGPRRHGPIACSPGAGRVRK